MMLRRCAALAMTGALILAGCSGANQDVPSAGGDAELGTAADMNPQDPSTLRQGGNLRLTLNEFPPNFNTLHIDGNVADAAAMMRAALPRAFRIAPDGTTTVNTDYFTDIELT